MNNIKKHLEEAEMTYIEHYIFALKLSKIMLKLSAKAAIHAIAPCWYKDDVSKEIGRLNRFFKNRKDNSS